jgi:phosphatidylglycerophosphatase A
LGFGAGLVPRAPGTAGALAALPLFWWLDQRLAPNDFLILLALLYLVGVWSCDRTARDMGVQDAGAIVWDEIVAFMLVLFFTPRSMAWQAFAFLLFRLFDIWKPGPVRYVESRFRGGFGIMVDDVIAGFLALICLALAKALGDALLG